MTKVISVFFFSSRRRHTRCYRDWSSDVCSSDLLIPEIAIHERQLPVGSEIVRRGLNDLLQFGASQLEVPGGPVDLTQEDPGDRKSVVWERVEIAAGGGS